MSDPSPCRYCGEPFPRHKEDCDNNPANQSRVQEERLRKREESREREKKISGWIIIICALAILYIAEQAGTVPFLIVFFALLIIYALSKG